MTWEQTESEWGSLAPYSNRGKAVWCGLLFGRGIPLQQIKIGLWQRQLVASLCHPVWLQAMLAHFSQTGEVDCFDSPRHFFFLFQMNGLSSLGLACLSCTFDFTSFGKTVALKQLILSFLGQIKCSYFLYSDKYTVHLETPSLHLPSESLTPLFNSHMTLAPAFIPDCLHEALWMLLSPSVSFAPSPSLRYIRRRPFLRPRQPANRFCAFPPARGGRLCGRQPSSGSVVSMDAWLPVGTLLLQGAYSTFSY